MSLQEWAVAEVGGESCELLNLEHPEVEARVMEEMGRGVKVFYDRRWEVTEVLTDWLGANRGVMEGKRVLVLGAGVGAEGVLLGRFAERVWLNDLAPVALELSGRQMERNGLGNYELLVGRYEELELPEVDLVVGSFLVYNEETRVAMERFLEGYGGEVVLVNEGLRDFRRLLEGRVARVFFEDEAGMMGVHFGGEGGGETL